MPESTFEEELKKSAQRILDRIGSIATTKYMMGGNGSPNPSKLTNRSGKTKVALTGGEGSINKITIEPNQMRLVYGVDKNVLPGIQMLEDGGTASDAQQRFFWWKYYNEADSLMKQIWFSMAKGEPGTARKRANGKTYGTHYFQSRQTVQNAVRDVVIEAKDIFQDTTYRFIQTSIRRIINDNS